MDVNLSSFGNEVIPLQPSEGVLLNIVTLVELSHNFDYDYEPFIELSNRIKDITHGFFIFDKKSFPLVKEVIDENSLEKKLQIPVDTITDFIMELLEIDEDDIEAAADKSGFIDMVKLYSNKLEELRKISNPRELEERFDLFSSIFQVKYGYVIESLDFIVRTHMKNKTIKHRLNRSILTFVTEYGDKFLLTSEDIELIKQGKTEDVYKKYINIGVDEIQNLIDNLDILEEELSTKDLDIVLKMDSENRKDKVELYIASRYLDCALESDNDQDKQIYLYYLSNFFERFKSKINTLRAYDKTNDEIITLNDLYNKYIRFLKDNPNLRIIDFKRGDFSDMNYQEIKEFMDEYLRDISANWDFLPPIKNPNSLSEIIPDEELEKIKEYIGKIENPAKRQKALADLELFIKKKMFFDSSDPFYRIKGKNTFSGYFGYIYSNGIVILERFYENAKKCIIASEQAIYCMTIQDFYTLSKLSKSNIIANNLCKRFIHKGDWQKKVQDVINVKSQIVTAKELDKLIQQGSVTI